MKKFFAFAIAMAMTVVANAGLMVTVTGNVVSFTSDIPVQQLDLGTMVVDGGVLTVGEVNGAFGAGSRGFSGADINAMAGAPVFTDGSVIAFSQACTSATKASGLLASFIVDGVNTITIGPETMLGSGVGAFVDYSGTGGFESLEGMVIQVPEPMTMSLLGLGGLVAARRRRA